MSETAIAKRPIVTLEPQSLLATAVEKGASVETLERLVALAKDVKAEQAKSAWFEAMSEFQRRCPEITKTKKADIPTAKGFYSYKFAPLDEIMSNIRPLLGELGLSIFWSSPAESPNGRVVVSCRVAHVMGHTEESGQVSLPIPDASERGGGNALQRVGSALSYARRYSLMSILGISPEDDDDAGSAGAGKSSTTQNPPQMQKTEPPPPSEHPPELPSVETWSIRCTKAQTREQFQMWEKAAQDLWKHYPETDQHRMADIFTMHRERLTAKKGEQPTLPGA